MPIVCDTTAAARCELPTQECCVGSEKSGRDLADGAARSLLMQISMSTNLPDSQTNREPRLSSFFHSSIVRTLFLLTASSTNACVTGHSGVGGNCVFDRSYGSVGPDCDEELYCNDGDRCQTAPVEDSTTTDYETVLNSDVDGGESDNASDTIDDQGGDAVDPEVIDAGAGDE
jgi:hypothetical protein